MLSFNGENMPVDKNWINRKYAKPTYNFGITIRTSFKWNVYVKNLPRTCVCQEFTAYVKIYLFVRERATVFRDLSNPRLAKVTTTALYKLLQGYYTPNVVLLNPWRLQK